MHEPENVLFADLELESIRLSVVAAYRVGQISSLRLPESVNRYRALVAELGNAPIDRGRAGEIVRSLIGDIQIARRDGYLVAKMGPRAWTFSPANARSSSGCVATSAARRWRRNA